MKLTTQKSMFMPSAMSGALLMIWAGQVLAEEQTSQQMERMVVTASLTEHTELTAPASVSVITAEDIAKMPVKDLSEAIRSSVGVNILSGSSYGRNSIRIRGLDSKHTLILINGRRINSQDALIRGNNFDLSSVPMSAIERIEVVRGPVSSLYGSEAMGGVVNVILKPASDVLSGSAGLEYENILEGTGGDGAKGQLYASGELTEGIAASVIIEGSTRDPWQTAESPKYDALEDKETKNVFGELNWQLTPEQTLIADMMYTNDEREADWKHPSNVNTQTNKQTSTRWNYGLTHEGAWDTVDTQARLYGEVMNLNDASTAYKNGAADVKLTSNTVDFKVSGLWSQTHEWVFGGEYRQSELNNDRDLLSGSIDSSQGAVFLQGQFQLGNLSLTLGGREDFHESFGSHFSPRAYAVYTVTDDFVLKGGAGGGFNAPTQLQSNEQVRVISCGNECWLMGSGDLKPETSVSYELGAAYDIASMGLGLTYYYTDIENKIAQDRSRWDTLNEMKVHTYKNIGKAVIKGVELEGWFDISEAITLSGNYTYTDAKDKKSGKTLQRTPEHLANFDFNWEVVNSVTLFARVNYIGDQVVSVKRKDKRVDGYTLAGIGAAYDDAQWNFKVGFSNLFDADLGEDYGYTEKGQSIYFNATYSF
ncbi:TonB-dependent receptor domain-containing protein [Vibrio azureus]|uniref:Colicin I receptor n=1 Tax=Vibrio azureus NBRC 104587 TaxID=1219077 RepID=U3C995_9VIBR|nr:colicin I receptor [Vibrio azureus NBRC 104587]